MSLQARPPFGRFPCTRNTVLYALHLSSFLHPESIRGVKTRINVTRKALCSSCTGTGRMAGAPEATCQQCGGAGKSALTRGLLQFSVTCAVCSGSGKRTAHCPACGGEG